MCARTVSDEHSVQQMALQAAPRHVSMAPQLSPPGKRPKGNRVAPALPMDNIAVLTAYTKKASEFAYQTAATIAQSNFYT